MWGPVPAPRRGVHWYRPPAGHLLPFANPGTSFCSPAARAPDCAARKARLPEEQIRDNAGPSHPEPRHGLQQRGVLQVVLLLCLRHPGKRVLGVENRRDPPRNGSQEGSDLQEAQVCHVAAPPYAVRVQGLFAPLADVTRVRCRRESQKVLTRSGALASLDGFGVCHPRARDNVPGVPCLTPRLGHNVTPTLSLGQPRRHKLLLHMHVIFARHTLRDDMKMSC